jgi:hypothetical protein
MKKALAQALRAKGLNISESMVVRCLLEDERRRIPTIEAIDAISAALGIPRPVIVAESIEQARELEAAVAFSEADAKMLALAAEVADQGDDGAQTRNSGGTRTEHAAAVAGRGARASAARSRAVRRPPRAG